MVFFPSCLKRRSVKSHEELSHHDVDGHTGSGSDSGCVLTTRKKHSAFSANLCVLMGHSTKNVFSHYSVPDTVLIYGEKTVKSPILCLQGTHSVVGDIKKSVITSYAWVRCKREAEGENVFFHLEWPVGSYLPENLRGEIHWLCLTMNSNDLKKMQKYTVGLNVYFILIFTLPFHNIFSWATTNPYICKHTLSGHRKQTCLTGLCLLWVSSACHRVVSSGPVCVSYLHLLELSNFSVCRVLVRAQIGEKAGKNPSSY